MRSPDDRRPGSAFFRWKHAPYMPVEFSGAAYRFGHSQVRPAYLLNPGTPFIPIFDQVGTHQLGDLRGFRRVPEPWPVDWGLFFDDFRDQPDPNLQFTRRIDPFLAPGLHNLPGVGEPTSLAARNLLRGSSLGLPSGQAVARFMGIRPESFEDEGTGASLGDLGPFLEALDLDDEVLGALFPNGTAKAAKQSELAERFAESTPLWYYVLAEALIVCEGQALGPVGGRIVAEVLCGLLVGDPFSYLQLDPTWTPQGHVLGIEVSEEMTVGTLLRIADAERQAAEGDSS